MYVKFLYSEWCIKELNSLLTAHFVLKQLSFFLSLFGRKKDVKSCAFHFSIGSMTCHWNTRHTSQASHSMFPFYFGFVFSQFFLQTISHWLRLAHSKLKLSLSLLSAHSFRFSKMNSRSIFTIFFVVWFRFICFKWQSIHKISVFLSFATYGIHRAAFISKSIFRCSKMTY